MKNNDQAALDLFSNYSAFMLTDDELLIIHGGTTNSGSGHGGGSSPGGGTSPGGSTTAPPATPQPAPPASPPVQPAPLEPISVTITADGTHALSKLTDAAIRSQTAHEADNLTAHVIHAIDNFLFGPSAPLPSPSIGGAGGAEGAGGTGG